MNQFTKFVITVAAALFFQPAVAKVTLPSVLTDNMVLQQKKNVTLWGRSTAATVKITTSWDYKSYTVAVTKDGSWETAITTPSYGGPYTITFDDGEKMVLKNILIGEVWLCSGQSNMEMPLDGWGKVLNYQQEIQNANYPNIRLLQAEHVDSAVPLDELKVQYGGWQVCSPQTISDFSSTAYFFAREVYAKTGVPIGLVHSSWSGTVAEAWTSEGALRTMHDFDKVLDELKADADRDAIKAKHDKEMQKWQIILDKADIGLFEWYAAGFDDSAWKTIPVPSLWENKGLPSFDGIVWYRKTINLTENFAGKEATLEYLADDDDELWVNGTSIGKTTGYTTQRRYTIPGSLLKKGKNVIVIRIFDGVGGGGIYGPDDIALKAGGKTVSLAGDWKFKEGVNLNQLPAMPYMPQGQNRPTALFNAMIHPILRMSFAGVIWYQGESNADRAEQYQTLFPLLINDWREKFNNKDMPFYFVQLANFMQRKDEPGPSAWAELREAQLMTSRSVPNTGMAVAIDIGDAEDIHPKNKQEVGRRLALIALAKTYKLRVPYKGPEQILHTVQEKNGKSIVIDFDTEKLRTSDGEKLRGFEIAGKDNVYYRADAKISGNKVIVSCPKVKDAWSVRYNWADNPDGNLVNEAGLPASPYRLNLFPGPKKV